MTLEESYRLLDLEAGVPDEEVRRAHHDLTKVWHPDRFGHDPELRRKAEEKLKAINQALETIRASREGGWPRSRASEDIRHDARRRSAVAERRTLRNRTWALLCALGAIFLLLRRPTPAGLVIALILFAVAIVFIARMRTEGRE